MDAEEPAETELDGCMGVEVGGGGWGLGGPCWAIVKLALAAVRNEYVAGRCRVVRGVYGLDEGWYGYWSLGGVGCAGEDADGGSGRERSSKFRKIRTTEGPFGQFVIGGETSRWYRVVVGG